MELLDLNKHSPEEFEGKFIFIDNVAYRIGKFFNEGGQKILHYLINEQTNTCHFLICFWIDQKQPRTYKEKKELAERIYGIDGMVSKPITSVMADFLYFPEFDNKDNKYHCRFYIQELLGQCPETTTPIEEEIWEHINKHEFELAHKKCHSFLENINPFNDTILNLHAYSYVNFCIQERNGLSLNEINEIQNSLINMIIYEPFYKANIYQAISIFEQLGLYDLAVCVFQRIKDRIFEIYAKKEIMNSVVSSLVKSGLPEEAEKYVRFSDDKFWNKEIIEQHKKNLKIYKSELNSISTLIKKQTNAKDDIISKNDFHHSQKQVANLYPYLWVSKLNLISYAINHNEELDDPTDCLKLFILSDDKLKLLYSQLHVAIYNLQRKIDVDNACDMLMQYMETIRSDKLPLIYKPLIVSYATLDANIELHGDGIKNLLERIKNNYKKEHRGYRLLHELINFYNEIV